MCASSPIGLNWFGCHGFIWSCAPQEEKARRKEAHIAEAMARIQVIGESKCLDCTSVDGMDPARRLPLGLQAKRAARANATPEPSAAAEPKTEPTALRDMDALGFTKLMEDALGGGKNLTEIMMEMPVEGNSRGKAASVEGSGRGKNAEPAATNASSATAATAPPEPAKPPISSAKARAMERLANKKAATPTSRAPLSIPHICTGSTDICTGTGLTPATSAGDRALQFVLAAHIGAEAAAEAPTPEDVEADRNAKNETEGRLKREAEEKAKNAALNEAARKAEEEQARQAEAVAIAKTAEVRWYTSLTRT